MITRLLELSGSFFLRCCGGHGGKWQNIPDDIDENDDDAVKEYIKKVWDDIGLPNGNYIDESAGLDEDAGFNIVRK